MIYVAIQSYTGVTGIIRREEYYQKALCMLKHIHNINLYSLCTCTKYTNPCLVQLVLNKGEV